MQIAICNTVECEFARAHGGPFAQHHELNQTDEYGDCRTDQHGDHVDDAARPENVERIAVRVHGGRREHTDEPCEYTGPDNGASGEYCGKNVGNRLPYRFAQRREGERPTQSDQSDCGTHYRASLSALSALLALLEPPTISG